MNKPRIRTIAAAIALVAAAGGTFAIAASPADTIAARQANFKKMGGAMKVIKDELAGSADKAKMAGAAKTIAAMARAQVPLFPKGTGPGAGVKTDALPAIWTDRATFDGHAKKLIAEADKLVMVSGTGNAAAIGAQFKAVGGTCGACHKQFRADD
ncbi:MAG: cytochrome C [Novosphingobium sp. 28-62-57]|uniref:c-type cytochrome n=1 Tax=unclassified Novosphingobium TaxID=2644732 RepID=UPI000BD8AF39|nr:MULTISPECIES: cytochrome c [unclassified Novosphingobium]OYW49940.1 MAG: cytochrome C [Novosphingobium sp. 12-62-10]OYZ12094.1 MAG: cytochrome C [Novosphingobium sp. 28-62-57]OZA39201.1 MAG: cytochrome C [Novosphingobium sp. 17-62-9]HQS68670.1 cytochrome c [Novosphingobium sp.]